LANTIQTKIVNAFKANIKPAIYLQILAVSIALCYFYVPASEPVFSLLGNLKASYGSLYAVISTAIFGGLIPYLIMLATKQIHFKPVAQLVFYCILWAILGFIIDHFYQFQGYLFGNNGDVSTIIKKVVLDQFGFNVLVGAPFVTIAFLLRDNQFNIKSWLSSINKKLFTEEIPVVLASTWIVWIPSVSVVYAMPSNLQIPLFNIVLCMFVLIVAILNNPNDQAKD
jgi:hypothetical protein